MLLMIEYNVVGESSVREEMGNVIIQNKIRLKLHEALKLGPFILTKTAQDWAADDF